MTAAFLPPAGNQPPLQNHAASAQQLARLLDALLILDVQRSCRVGELALRVGLQPDRLRELLAGYMIAAAEVVGPTAGFTIEFGAGDGQDEPAASDTVRVSDYNDGSPVLDDVGRRAVSVEDVARGLLSARALLLSPHLEPRHRLAVQELADQLESAMSASVDAPIGEVAAILRAAVEARQRARFRYRDPWSGVVSHPEVEPYDVRRHRDRYLLDAGPEPAVGFRSYDISAISQVDLLTGAGFTAPDLPPRERRDEPLRVVLRVPKYSRAEDRLFEAWKGKVVSATADRVDVAINVDRSGVADRVGVLVLQLGWPAEVVEPVELASTVACVAQRLLATLPGQS